MFYVPDATEWPKYVLYCASFAISMLIRGGTLLLSTFYIFSFRTWHKPYLSNHTKWIWLLPVPVYFLKTVYCDVQTVLKNQLLNLSSKKWLGLPLHRFLVTPWILRSKVSQLNIFWCGESFWRLHSTVRELSCLNHSLQKMFSRSYQ